MQDIVAKGTAIFLGAALLFSGTAAAAVEDEAGGILQDSRRQLVRISQNAAQPMPTISEYDKTEVVYATLDADGKCEDIYVVNTFDVESGGKVVDFGDYSEREALSNSATMGTIDEQSTIDLVDLPFSYQGKAQSNAQLPWSIRFDYYMNGEKLSKDKIAGLPGNFQIKLTTKDNPLFNGTMYGDGSTGQTEGASSSGKENPFFESYMLQASFSFDSTTWEDIRAEGGSVLQAGSDKTVSFTVMPDSDSEFKIEGYTRKFELADVQIVAIPYSSVIELPDTSGLLGDMDQLSSGIASLSDGVDQLSSGIDQFEDGVRRTAGGSGEFATGLEEISKNSATLVGGSAQISAALGQIASGLSSMDLSALDQLSTLSSTLNALAAGLDTMSTQCATTASAYDQALGAIYANQLSLTDAQVQALVDAQTDDANKATAQQLARAYDTYKALQQNRATLQAVSGLLGTLSAGAGTQGSLANVAQTLRTIASSAAGSSGAKPEDIAALSGLAGSMRTLADQYAAIHDGLVGYTGGVDALSTEYSKLNAGLQTLSSAAAGIADGAGALRSGVTELRLQTMNLPELMRSRMDEMISPYDATDAQPTSFVDSRNSVELVQFVMSVDPIVAEKPKNEVEAVETEPTIIDRLLALFS